MKIRVLILAACSVSLAAGLAAARQDRARAKADIPPLSYVCPMPVDADVVEDKPGKCPKCGMTLVPVRLDSVYTCPVHSIVTEANPGKCPIDGRDLVRVTMTVAWSCPGSAKESASPGTCPDGTPMAKKYSPRAHGNHNPQHGGQFFMAPDSWHHLEGAYQSNGVFRLYLYDDFTKPLADALVRGVTARVITQQTFDPATKTTKEITAVPLVRKGRYLEAKIGKLPLPAKMSARVQFEKGQPEHLFDFAFESFSKEPAGPPRTTMTTPMPDPPTPPATTTTATTSTPPVEMSPPPSVDPGLLTAPIPETIPEILSQLRTRSEQIRGFIERGSFASVYVPAFQAKDLALALDEKKGTLPADRRKIAEPAIAQLVRAAYLLDAFGDIGNRQQILDAYARFTAAAKEIESAFAKE